MSLPRARSLAKAAVGHVVVSRWGGGALRAVCGACYLAGMDLFVDPRNAGSGRGDPRPRRHSPPRPPDGGWAAWYLRDEDDVGEGTEQHITVRTLLAALSELARERGWARTLVAGDQFFAWVESEPLVRISPDVYLLDDPPTPPYPAMWRTWLEGQAAPRFAVEVVSDDWAKDYLHAPRKYDQLGTRELVIFDPEATLTRRGQRTVLQVFRRDADDALVRVETGEGPFYSAELDAWLVVQRGPAGHRLRIARDPAGADLVATADEVASALRLENSALRLENSSLHARVGALEAQVAELQTVIAVQKDLLEQQAAQLRDRDATIARLEAAIAARDATIARLEAALAARDATIARLEAALVVADTRHAGLQTRVEALEAALTRLLGPA